VASLNRKSNYQKLREVGYNSREANKYKDRDTRTIIKLVKIKEESNQQFKSKLSEVL